MSRASLTSKLRKKKIPIPSEPTIANLEHRLNNWEEGDGWLVRLIRRPRRAGPQNKLTKGFTYWIPNSDFARQIVKSGEVFMLGRTPVSPRDAVFLDIPTNFNNEEEE